MPSTLPSQPALLRVLVIEDHPVVLEGLSGLLVKEGGFSVVGQAGSVREAREVASHCAADVILLDLVLHDEDGLALIKDLAEIAPKSRVLVFSLQPEEIYAERCLRAGAFGYVMKQAPMETLYAALRTVSKGGFHVGARVAAAVLGGLRTSPHRAAVGDEAGLTDRELQVYRLTGLGLPTRVIAEKLGVSARTVEAHHENIKNKLGVETHVALVARAALWVRSLHPSQTPA